MSSTSSKRPLSPHLQIYRPQMTSVLSIFHRMAGIALAAGSLLVMWGLLAAASGPKAYEVFQEFTRSPLGLFMLFGWSAAFFYHLCNGIRHLIWDTGRLFVLKDAFLAGKIVLAASVVLTVAAWICAWSF
jgi:succinate dehydrogenase / fumarate reductase cytochrome b subunit